MLEFIPYYLCKAQPQVFVERYRVSVFYSSKAASMCESISSHCIASGCEAHRGTDISGAWPSSSCLYLTLYCDDPVMRTSTVPLWIPVGNLHPYLHLHLHYHMVLYMQNTSHCCNGFFLKQCKEW